MRRTTHIKNNITFNNLNISTNYITHNTHLQIVRIHTPDTASPKIASNHTADHQPSITILQYTLNDNEKHLSVH